jgi:hypothetical protein
MPVPGGTTRKLLNALWPHFRNCIALHVALVFAVHVHLEGARVAELVDHHRVVDDQVHGVQRVDLLRVAAQRLDPVAHRGEVDHGRHAGEILHQHARRAIGDLARVLAALGGPCRERLDVVDADGLAVLEAQHVLQHHLQRGGQLGEIAEPAASAAGSSNRRALVTDLERLAGFRGVVADGNGHGVQLAKTSPGPNGIQSHTLQGPSATLRYLVTAPPPGAALPRPARGASPPPRNRLPLNPMVLTVTDLSCARGAAQVLAGVSFSVSPGEALILRGPNGAGKTTLLRTLAGLTPPLSGAIDCAPDTIAYAGHADGLKAQLTVAENLTFWARAFAAHDIAPALDAFDLHELTDRRAGEMSAGQKRRLSLARLLVTAARSGASMSPPCRSTWTTSPASPARSRRTWHRAARPSSRPISTSACPPPARST